MLIVYYIALWPLATHITVFFHELGHSVAALLFSKAPVEMYVGSYGNKAQCRKLTFGRLSVFLEKRSFLWDRGLCVPLERPSGIWREFMQAEAKTLFQRALEQDPMTFEVEEYLGMPGLQ